MMRGQVSAAVCALVLPTCLGGCAREEQKMNPENVLELRLGGNYESLAARLRKPPPGGARLIMEPPKTTPSIVAPEIVGPETVAPQTIAPQPEITDIDPPRTASPPQDDPPPSRPEFRFVTLAEGQTLYGLCGTELGHGGRWKEVAALNGWSEAQIERLPVGQKVKLPVR